MKMALPLFKAGARGLFRATPPVEAGDLPVAREGACEVRGAACRGSSRAAEG